MDDVDDGNDDACVDVLDFSMPIEGERGRSPVHQLRNRADCFHAGYQRRDSVRQGPGHVEGNGSRVWQ